MERMSEGERVAAWLVFLFLVMSFGTIWQEQSKNERMAMAGYIPQRLAGSTEIYWIDKPSVLCEEELKRY